MYGTWDQRQSGSSESGCLLAFISSRLTVPGMPPPILLVAYSFPTQIILTESSLPDPLEGVL